MHHDACNCDDQFDPVLKITKLVSQATLISYSLGKPVYLNFTNTESELYYH